MSTRLIERLNKINGLIVQRKTGSPYDLSKKLKVSLRCISKDIAFLKSLGAPVEYSRKCNTYFYREAGYINFSFIKHDYADASGD